MIDLAIKNRTWGLVERETWDRISPHVWNRINEHVFRPVEQSERTTEIISVVMTKSWIEVVLSMEMSDGPR